MKDTIKEEAEREYKRELLCSNNLSIDTISRMTAAFSLGWDRSQIKSSERIEELEKDLKKNASLVWEVTNYTSKNKVGRPGDISTKCLIEDHKQLQSQLNEAVETIQKMIRKTGSYNRHSNPKITELRKIANDFLTKLKNQ